MQNILQNIVTQLENQDFNQAIELCQNTLKYNNHPQVHLFLGIALGEQKHIKRAVEIFSKLISHFPKNPDIYYNFAIILAKNNLKEDAIKNYQSCLTINPKHASAWNNIGEIYQANSNYADAINCFNKASSLVPDNLQYLRNLSFSYYYNKNLTQAKTSFLLFINSELADDNDTTVYLETLMALELYQQIIRDGVTALNKFPENTEILNIIGLSYLEQKEIVNAINYLERSYAQNPKKQETTYNLALAYSLHAEKTKLDKILNDILLNKQLYSYIFVASIHEQNNQLDDALNISSQGLDISPNDSELLYIQSKIYKQLKQYDKASELISTAIDNQSVNIEPRFFHEKAQLFEKLKQYDEAWLTAQKANDVCLANWIKTSSKKDKYIDICHKMAGGDVIYKPANTDHSIGNNGENLIFIFGFPRSGTTLLDSILSAHSTTTVLEELPIIKEAFSLLFKGSPENYFKEIQQLSNVQKKELQENYYNSVKNHINWNGDGILIDKSPLNTSLVAFIHAIFPDAKIIFSVRHPLDVCISCFFQEFRANSFMTNMVNIEKIANTYSAMLNIWMRSVEQFNINVYYQHYEKIVDDFESEVKSLAGYLELPWQNDLLTFQGSLKNRGTITNPSYNQVNQPIYPTSKNRYKNYLPYLDEATKILKPWIDKFNYPLI